MAPLAATQHQGAHSSLETWEHLHLWMELGNFASWWETGMLWYLRADLQKTCLWLWLLVREKAHRETLGRAGEEESMDILRILRCRMPHTQRKLMSLMG